VLLPRTKGFVATVQALRGNVPFLYDITVGYKGNNGRAPNIYDVANGYCKYVSNACLSISHMRTHSTINDRNMEIHFHCRRWSFDQLPKGDEELAKWCYKCFEEKDALLDKFHTTGFFPGAEVDDPYRFVYPL